MSAAEPDRCERLRRGALEVASSAASTAPKEARSRETIRKWTGEGTGVPREMLTGFVVAVINKSGPEWSGRLLIGAAS
jgi:hypothetical protein